MKEEGRGRKGGRKGRERDGGFGRTTKNTSATALIPTGTPLKGTSNAGGVGRNRDSSLYLALVPAVSAATDQLLPVGSPVDHGLRPASYDTSVQGSEWRC